MNVVRFLARDAAEAVGQIRSQLGPEAVVLSVTQVPGEGLSRLWRKPQLEVLAGLPEQQTAILETGSRVSRFDQNSEVARMPELPGLETTDLRRTVVQTGAKRSGDSELPLSETDSPAELGNETESADPGPPGLGGSWRTGALLHQMGLQPLNVEKVLERARSQHGAVPPASFAHEMALVQSCLASFWRPAPPPADGAGPVHVFIGPPGSGKTTVLCKWLAKMVLAGGQKARVWRLDGRAANFAGLLDMYGEILDVPVEREWNVNQAAADFDVGFVDFPGVAATDAAAMDQLRDRLAAIPGAQVHLVLNAAYDVSVLLGQARAFAALPVWDVIFSHVDEEKRRGKLWNFVVGTNFTVRFLSGGQNIPGDFFAATPDLLMPLQTLHYRQITHGFAPERVVGKRFAENWQRTSG